MPPDQARERHGRDGGRMRTCYFTTTFSVMVFALAALYESLAGAVSFTFTLYVPFFKPFFSVTLPVLAF